MKIISLTAPILGKLHHAHCSSIVAFPDGKLFAVYYHAIKEAHGTQAIYGKWKTIESESWSEPVVICKEFQKLRMEGNPVLWIAPDTQRLWLIYSTSWGGWSTCIIRCKYSDDQGRTWSKNKKIYPHISRVPKNPPIMLSNGQYLLGATIEGRECMPVFYISDNQGISWKELPEQLTVPPALIPPSHAATKKFPQRMLDQPTLVERKDHSVFCLMRAYKPLGKMFQSISLDFGKTWSPPEPGILPNPDGGFHMIRLNSGHIAIIYNHSSTERNPLSVALSEDEGKSWQFRRNILEFHPDSTEGNQIKSTHHETFGYPTMFQGKDGIIHATWSYNYIYRKNETEVHITDINYTNFTEDWIRKKPFFDEIWEF